METERFLAYLRYRLCFTEQTHQHFSIYRSKQTGRTSYIRTNEPELPPDIIVIWCRNLGIPVPDVDEVIEQEGRM